MPDFYSAFNLDNMLGKQENVYGGYGSTQVKPNWSSFVGPQDQNTHLNLPKLGDVKPVDLSQPQVTNTKPQTPWLNNSVNFLTTGLQYLSNTSSNSYEAAQNRFNQKQLSQQNINKDLYSTKQDYFGTPSFADGGIFGDMPIEDLQAMKTVGGFEDFSSDIDEGINYHKSLEDQAKFNVMRQEMEDKYKQALSNIPKQQWQDNYQFSTPTYNNPYSSEESPPSTGYLDNRGLGARMSQSSVPSNLPSASGTLKEFFYNNPENKQVYRYKNGVDNSYKGPMSGHWNHAHLAADPATIQQILPILPKFGLTHSEGFGKTVHRVHAKDSHHYHNEAIDINSADGKDEAKRMDNLINYLKQNKIIK